MGLEERIEYAAMKARHEKKLRPWYQKWWGKLILTISSLLLICLIITGLYVVDSIKNIRLGFSQQTLADQQQAHNQAINGPGNNYQLGPINQAPVTVIEFSDFACPFCQQSVAGLKKAAAQYPTQLKIVFRDYPLHENSVDLANAARCAGEQNKFWEIHDIFFANQDKLTSSGDELRVALLSITQTLGINSDQFNTCLDEQRYLIDIKQDFQDGETLQIQGTPTWFINGKRLTGYMPEEQFLLLITRLMEQ